VRLAPVFTHPACAGHDPGPGHPEAPARLAAILDAVRAADPAALREAAPAPLAAVRRAHPDAYLDALRKRAALGGGRLDPDTVMNAASWDAALGAAGAALAALESALAGRPAFAAGRPPGHHALADRSMGFCLLANAVIAAREALARGAGRVLVVDWDVHHGNGTQALVEAEPAIRFVSMHQWPHWPFSGEASERGIGNVWNVPLPAGLPPARYVEALWEAVDSAGQGWDPDVLLISAGFDSMAGDPLGGFTLEPDHFAAWVARFRERFPRAAVAAFLEGGYAPARLAAGVVATAAALAG
jgi:acetoin utilization deacetylase AcuC-like enzyme